MTHVQEEKQALRRLIRDRLAAIPEGLRRERSRQSCEILRQQPVWRRARAVLFYAPLPSELDLSFLMEEALREKRLVALPRFHAGNGEYEAVLVTRAGECAPGRFGIVEPGEGCPVLPGNRLDLALVPGVAFDPLGHRLGRGRGYYDRLLAMAGGVKCGVAFDEQVADHVPVEPHDVTLDCLLTPTRWQEVSA
jgi:5-formyltetrahydrofolate cyclo-ligase